MATRDAVSVTAAAIGKSMFSGEGMTPVQHSFLKTV
jgi:hypothetical protein